MEKKYRKNLYYAHNFRGVAVLAEEFETLAKFYHFAKENGMQVCFCPLNPASTMVKNLSVLKPKDYETLPLSVR
jgi:hypothetical protein